MQFRYNYNNLCVESKENILTINEHKPRVMLKNEMPTLSSLFLLLYVRDYRLSMNWMEMWRLSKKKYENWFILHMNA